jgi:hypothetical protein
MPSSFNKEMGIGVCTDWEVASCSQCVAVCDQNIPKVPKCEKCLVKTMKLCMKMK